MAKPLRIIYDNAADRSATLTASSIAGELIPANLLKQSKFDVWRSTTNTATLTLTFNTSELMGGVCLAFSNLTHASTMRVRGYSEISDVSAVVDTGTIFASPYQPINSLNWGFDSLGDNKDADGDNTYAVAWMNVVSVKKVVIDLVDTLNPDGFIQVGRLILGSYWSPTYNASIGAEWSMEDTSKHYRSDAGALLTDVGAKYKRIKFDMSILNQDDRARLVRILKNNGMAYPVFISLDPESKDTEAEQAYQIYGKLTKTSSVTVTAYNIYSAPCEIEEI